MPEQWVGYGPGVPTWEEWTADRDRRNALAANEQQIRADVAGALEENRQLAAQDQSVLDAAAVMIADRLIADYDATGKTQVQVLTDVLAGLKRLDGQVKQLAQGVKILTQHDQVALTQRNYLARLAVGLFDATD